MLYLANPTTPSVRAAMINHEIGMIATPAQGNRIPPGVLWCADNGCFAAGYPGDEKWFTWLQRHAHNADLCLFAVAPDVVGDAAATLERSRPWLARIRDLGYPAAYVAQDHAEDHPPPWPEIDALFIGGTTGFKLGPVARQLVTEAHRRGKWVHMGRVNSERRYRYAAAIGCDSADGTFLAFGPDTNLPQLRAWLRSVDQPPLWNPA